MTEEIRLPASLEPRFPRLMSVPRWLRRHWGITLAAATAFMAAVFIFDLLTPAEWIAGGFYLVPLGMIAVSLGSRATIIGSVIAVFLITLVMGVQHVFSSPQHLLYLYFIIVACGGLVLLSDLLEQLDEVTRKAVHRARLAQAEADIVGQSTRQGGLEALIGTAVRRIADEVEADRALAFLLHDGRWRGIAGLGITSAPDDLDYARDDLPLAVEVLERDRVLAIHDMPDWFASRGLVAPSYVDEYGLQRVLVVPLRAFGEGLGVMLFGRSVTAGSYSNEQVRFASSVAGHIAVAIENDRLLAQLDAKRRDLALVVESSLDFAATLEPRTVIESVVERLVAALDVSACDIHVLEPELEAVRTVVSYDNGRFDFSDVVGRLWSLREYPTTAAVVSGGTHLVVDGLDDPRLTGRERELLRTNEKSSELALPLKARDRVIGVVELFDDKVGRTYPPEEIELAEAICQFAALALENAHLYDTQRETAAHLERLAGQLQTLQQVSLTLGRLRDEGSVLREAVETGGALLDADRVAYVVRDRDVSAVRALHDRNGFSDVHTEQAGKAVEALDQALPRIDVPEGDALEPSSSGGLMLVRDGALVVPLKRHRQNAVAAMVFERPGRPFVDDDMRLASTLAAQLGLTLRNVHAFQREHEIAETFQTALLVEPPMLAGAEIGVRYQAAAQAARVGGDFYDIVTLGPGRVMIAVGDVCGRGLDAAVETALVRYTLRAYAREGSPGEALSRLNAALTAQEPELPFVTVVLAYLDVYRRTLEYAIAGHPRPLVLAGRRRYPIAQAGGFPVSLFAGETYPTNRCVLPDDATLVFYTDGLTEARRGERLLGEKGVRETVRRHLDQPAQALAESLLSRAARYAGGTLDDDMAVVVVRLP